MKQGRAMFWHSSPMAKAPAREWDLVLGRPRRTRSRPGWRFYLILRPRPQQTAWRQCAGWVVMQPEWSATVPTYLMEYTKGRFEALYYPRSLRTTIAPNPSPIVALLATIGNVGRETDSHVKKRNEKKRPRNGQGSQVAPSRRATLKGENSTFQPVLE